MLQMIDTEDSVASTPIVEAGRSTDTKDLVVSDASKDMELDLKVR